VSEWTVRAPKQSDGWKKELRWLWWRIPLPAVAALAALPDDRIDTSDIPEITATTGWIRNPMYKPLTRSVTIRLNAPDIVVAQVSNA
jgi:hypothetical protein